MPESKDIEALKKKFLPKQPETEIEYWIVIEALGGHIFWKSHDIHRYLEEKREAVWNSIEDAKRLQQQLVDEIVDKFGVISPKDSPPRSDENPPPAPEGKIYYRDWYPKMKEEYYSTEYEAIICSACPLSNGLDYMISLGNIPCSVWSGVIYRLTVPFECEMVQSKNWGEGKLHTEIIKKGGDEALTKFLKKKEQIKDALSSAADNLIR